MKLKKNDDDIIDRRNYFLVNYGVFLIIGISIATLAGLYFLKIDDRSILELILDYYFKK